MRYQQTEVEGKKSTHVLQMMEEIRVAFNIVNVDKQTMHKNLLISG
jgi:predicted nuclease of restriction endonuclease-like (RecB) superfamily